MRNTPGNASSRRIDMLLVLPFLILFMVQLAHHELWRDELNAWGIALASSTPKSLYQHIRYEGHPSLWYIVLWFPSRLTASPMAMKVVQGFIGIAIYLVIALRSPFTRLEKALLYLSYFISFEYTVMSRMYGLGLLLLLTYAYRRSRYPRQFVGNAALLALAANTDVTAMFLASALLLEYALATYPAWKRGEIDKKAARRGLIIYAAGLAALFLALRISPHISWRTTGVMFAFARAKWHLVSAALSYLILPWFPIAKGEGFPQHFWNAHTFQRRSIFQQMGLCAAMTGVYAYIFRREWRLCLVVGLTAAGAILFAHLIYFGGMRHYGITFTAFLVALWMQRYRKPQFSWPVLGLLLLSAAGGAGAVVGQWNHPFSQGRNTVAWLRKHHLDKGALVGTPDTSVAGIAEQLQRPIYFLDCNCSDTFLLFSNRRDDFEPDSTPERLLLASRKLHAPELIFITAFELPAKRVAEIEKLGMAVEPLAQFTGAEEPEENFYVLRIRQAPPI